MLTYNNNNILHPSTDTCLAAVCGPRPSSPTNGAWPVSCIDSGIGETCTATCNLGYTTTPAPTIRCVLKPDGLSGSWQTVNNGGRCEKGVQSLWTRCLGLYPQDSGMAV